MKIGVFDSGMGGLTVLKELIETYPNAEYIYYGDTIHLPYGQKTKEELYQYSTHIIDLFISKGVSMIVIACGTVSTNILAQLKEVYTIPIVDVISPVLSYIENEQLSKVGIFATTMTVQSGVFLREQRKENILEIATPEFVTLIESGLEKTIEARKTMEYYLEKMREQKIEHIILGCTHYPILKPDFELIYPCDYINMGKILVKELNITLNVPQKVEVYFSRRTKQIDARVKELLNVPVKWIEREEEI